ncbi:hypothetical protein LIER_37590 [Lithospermum erythrorhizon]|uniref:Retroviral polymerase SH3-like domain-containing protein n=1 Tax=Lithospermum erythrorhizon TaxID=34254 RepID=A0AAV3PP70_LITER
MFSAPPDISHLKIFGYLCYIANTMPYKTKFDQRSVPGIFIGYPSQNKGFKIYNITTKQVVVSRDVLFHEHLFPFHKNFPKDKWFLIDHTMHEEVHDCLPLVPVTHNPPTPIEPTIVPVEPEIADSNGHEDSNIPLLSTHDTIPVDVTSSNNSAVSSSLHPRESNRWKQIPIWMKDYQVYTACLQSDESPSIIAHMSFLAQL